MSKSKSKRELGQISKVKEEKHVRSRIRMVMWFKRSIMKTEWSLLKFLRITSFSYFRIRSQENLLYTDIKLK